ncbi:MAG: hypothetical protein U1F45_18815 [Burkholderiales bacterium]
MRTVVRLVLWNGGFALAILALLAVAATFRMDMLAFGLPGYLRYGSTMLGAKFARRRSVIITCAVVSVFVLIQIAVFVFFAWWQRGFGNTQSSTEQVLIIYVIVSPEPLSSAGFLRAKLRTAVAAGRTHDQQASILRGANPSLHLTGYSGLRLLSPAQVNSTLGGSGRWSTDDEGGESGT